MELVSMSFMSACTVIQLCCTFRHHMLFPWSCAYSRQVLPPATALFPEPLQPSYITCLQSPVGVKSLPCNVLQELRGSLNVTKMVISPATACPKLAHLDLFGCPKLTSILIQSQSLLTLNLTNCTQLTKVLSDLTLGLASA